MAGRSLLPQIMLLGTTICFTLAQIPSHAPVLFPDAMKTRTRSTPGCARGNMNPSAPCEADIEYNTNIKFLVNSILSQNSSLNEVVTDPALRFILEDTGRPFIDPAIQPTTRFGGPRETPACTSREELIFPQRAKNPRDEWVFVVNQENVKQALRVERCFNEGRACDFGIASIRDVSTVCRQKYVYRRMLTVGSNNIEPEEVLMPSCCVCYIRRNNNDIASRVGDGNGTIAVPVTEIPSIQPPAHMQPAAADPGHSFVSSSGSPIGFQPVTNTRRADHHSLSFSHRRRAAGNPYLTHGEYYFAPGRR